MSFSEILDFLGMFIAVCVLAYTAVVLYRILCLYDSHDDSNDSHDVE